MSAIHTGSAGESEVEVGNQDESIIVEIVVSAAKIQLGSGKAFKDYWIQGSNLEHIHFQLDS